MHFYPFWKMYTNFQIFYFVKQRYLNNYMFFNGLYIWKMLDVS